MMTRALFVAWALSFAACSTDRTVKADGSIDWVQVTDVTIVELGDYHD